MVNIIIGIIGFIALAIIAFFCYVCYAFLDDNAYTPEQKEAFKRIHRECGERIRQTRELMLTINQPNKNVVIEIYKNPNSVKHSKLFTWVTIDNNNNVLNWGVIKMSTINEIIEETSHRFLEDNND